MANTKAPPLVLAPDSAANPDAPMKNPHSVVTAHLIDREGEPTRQALEEIIGFFRMRLAGGAPATAADVGS